MKTPREILLQYHQATDAKLSQIRRDVVVRMEKPPGRPAEWLPLRALRKLWDELIWPVRRTWAGLAAAWIFLLIANGHLTADRPVASAEATNQAAGFWLMFREQNQLIAELSGAAEPKTVTPPNQSAPRPRSQAGRKSATV